jgi:hypothetical protein
MLLMRQTVLIAITTLVLVAGCGHEQKFDDGGHRIVYDWHGQRIYNADVKYDPSNPWGIADQSDPWGIAPPRPVTSIVAVPGPLVWRAVEDLTAEDREWLSWRAELKKKAQLTKEKKRRERKVGAE